MTNRLVHGTAVAIGGEAVMIAGPSGVGKSDLALRLIDRGAVLVADDQVELVEEGGRVVARCPAAIDGLMEVRGVGIVAVASAGPAPLRLWIDLGVESERLPEVACKEGTAVPRLVVDPRASSAPIKVELALHRLKGPDIVWRPTG